MSPWAIGGALVGLMYGLHEYAELDSRTTWRGVLLCVLIGLVLGAAAGDAFREGWIDPNAVPEDHFG